MKTQLNLMRPLFRRRFTALFLPFLAATALSAAPPRDRDRDRVPQAVTDLDSVSHKLVESFESDLRRHRHAPPRSEERRFLDALRGLEAATHTLRADVEGRQPAKRLQNTLYSVRNSMDKALQASRSIRLADRTRGLLWQAKGLVSQVEEMKGHLFARASHGNRHDDHRHGDRDRDRRPGPGGILGRIFGN